MPLIIFGPSSRCSYSIPRKQSILESEHDICVANWDGQRTACAKTTTFRGQRLFHDSFLGLCAISLCPSCRRHLPLVFCLGPRFEFCSCSSTCFGCDFVRHDRRDAHSPFRPRPRHGLPCCPSEAVARTRSRLIWSVQEAWLRSVP
jgi:hypothetical protein